METDSLLLCPVRRKKNLMMMKKGWKKKERKKKRIITRFASCETLHPSSFHPVKQTVSYANCHARTQWNWIRANDPVDDFVPRFSLSLSLLYPQLPFSPSPLKNEKCLFRNGSNGFIEVRRVYLGIYHDVAAAAQLCLFKQREMEQKRKRKIKKKIVAVSRATGLRTIGRKT